MTPRSADELWELLRARVAPDARRWLEETVDRVRQERTALAVAFPAVGRRIGRQRLQPDDGRTAEHGWTVDDAGRTLLLLAAGPGAWEELDDLYRFGDAAERRAVLRALPLLSPPSPTDGGGNEDSGDSTGPDVGLRLVDDAVRSNDTRLIAAALNPYALDRLGDDAFNQAVLKCVFVGLPLTGLDGVAERANPALSRMLAAYARERVAAGRDVPDDVWPLVDAFPPHDELAAIEAELQHAVASRRDAAAAALARRNAQQTTRRRQANGHRPA